MISIIIPAYNEEKYLEKTISFLKNELDKLLKINPNIKKYEIIVVNNNSADSTNIIAQKFADKVINEEKRCIAAVRNKGASAASGEILVFIDADSFANCELINAAWNKIKENHIFCGCLVKFDEKLSLLEKIMVLPWDIISLSGPFMAGSFMCVKKEHFKQINGFDETLLASEEINLSVKLNTLAKKLNLKKGFILKNPRIITSARKLRKYSKWFIIKTFFLFGLNIKKRTRDKKYCKLWYED